MTELWEIRGLFGNEYAMENAIEELKKHQGYEWVILDRRNLSVRFAKRNEETEEMVKRTFEIHHGFAESEGPLGKYDRDLAAQKLEKEKKAEEKRKRAAKK